MSVERKLLRRWYNGDLFPQEYIQLMKETKELLAQPQQDNTQYLLDQVARLTAENAMLKEKWLAQPEQNPVAWIDAGSLKSLQESTGYALRYLTNDVDNLKPTDVPLYLAPPKREPLGEEESYHEAKRLYEAEDGLWYEDGFVDGLKFAEKMHGIGGGE